MAFPGNKFNGDIAPELVALVESGTVRTLDLISIGKDEDGGVLVEGARIPHELIEPALTALPQAV